MRMRICRVAFTGQGIDYERSAVRKALEEGQLEVQSTTAWLDAAVARIKARGGSASVTAADAHQDGVLELVREQALANTKWCKVQDLPEVFAMDVGRFNDFRNEVRRLAVVGALANVVIAHTRAQGVTIDGAKATEIGQECDSIMEQTKSAQDIVSEVTDLAHGILICHRAGSARPQLEKALLKAMKAKAGTLRTVLTKRVTAVVSRAVSGQESEVTVAQLEKLGLGFGVDAVKGLTARIGAFVRHTELVFRPLYTAILTSA